jgi:hypothetical protein
MSAKSAIVRAFEAQDRACERLGSPLTARICRIFAERLDKSVPLGGLLFAWPGDPSAGGDSVPLRLCGALHALVRAEPDIGLAQIYPPFDPPDDDAIWALLVEALENREDFIRERLNFSPQTNEIGRSSVLYCGLSYLTGLFGLPIILSELGSSAGLNLICDQYAHRLDGTTAGQPGNGILLEPKWHGQAPPPHTPAIAERRGCDVNPLDIHDNSDMARMLSFIWPDQSARLRRTEKAIELARLFFPPAAVDRCDAADWLEQRLATPHEGRLHVVAHTIAWQYFPKQVQDRCRALIHAAGSTASGNAPVAWLSLEAADGLGASIRLARWPSGEAGEVGRAHYHGQWIDWYPDGKGE